MGRLILLYIFLFGTYTLYAQNTATISPVNEEFPKHLRNAQDFIRDGKFEQARSILADIERATLSPEQKANWLTVSGALNMSTGRNDLALDALQNAITIWQQSGKIQTLDAANTQAVLGNLYRATGKYAQAEEQLNMALMVRQSLLNPTDEVIAASLNDLGLVYTFSDVDKALDLYEKALLIYQKAHHENDPKIAIAKTNIGYLYSRLELFGDAVNNFEASLAIWDKVYPGAHPTKGFVLFSLGQTYEKMKNLKAARGYYERALSVYEQSYQGKHPDLARAYNALGNIDRAEGKFESGLIHFQRALATNHPGFGIADYMVNPSVRQYYDGNVLLYSLMYKAQALEEKYFRKTLKFKDLLLAIKTLQSCDTLIGTLRQQITNESDKIALGAVAEEIYADGVRISSEAAKVAWRKQDLLKLAFFFAEKSKSAVLLGAISDSNAKAFAGISPSLLEEEKQIKSAIALCSQKLAQKPREEEERYLRQTFYELNRNYAAFGQRLEKEFPAYYNLKYNSSSPSISDLQQRLPPSTLVISYFTDDKHNILYRFFITSSNYSVDEIALPADFDRLVTGLRNGIFFSELKTFIHSSNTLASLVLPKRFPSGIKDLAIIPSSRLSTIPFETLLVAPPREESFQELSYLVGKYSVRYEFSCGLILQKKDTQPNLKPSILLCAPVTFEASQSLADLPGTENEVKEISQLFSSKTLNNKLLLGSDAHEQNVKEEDLSSFTFLHFATHGVVDASNPELSRIFLKSGPSSEDGYLYSGEIYNLQLNADLVTLSACQTGLGKISKGEGVIGLSRALIYAGARNCLVSFWKVSDESTSMLMRDYYLQLLNDPARNLSATLQIAKRRLIASEEYNAPFFWAPFILIGF